MIYCINMKFALQNHPATFDEKPTTKHQTASLDLWMLWMPHYQLPWQIVFLNFDTLLKLAMLCSGVWLQNINFKNILFMWIKKIWITPKIWISFEDLIIYVAWKILFNIFYSIESIIALSRIAPISSLQHNSGYE